jgi:hypothetical protein
MQNQGLTIGRNWDFSSLAHASSRDFGLWRHSNLGSNRLAVAGFCQCNTVCLESSSCNKAAEGRKRRCLLRCSCPPLHKWAARDISKPKPKPTPDSHAQAASKPGFAWRLLGRRNRFVAAAVLCRPTACRTAAGFTPEVSLSRRSRLVCVKTPAASKGKVPAWSRSNNCHKR